MATESSAIAQLVNLAHQEEIRSVDQAHTGSPRSPGPVLSGPLLTLIGIIVIGASVAGGYFLARQQTSVATDEPRSEAAVDPGAKTPVPAALVAVSPDAREEEIEPEQNEELGEVDIELAKSTGFDVLVSPSGAKVTLDGQLIGAAPLRVRNLLPGAHAIDIEGPEGYFGQHLEFDLSAGKAEVLKLDLDPVGGEVIAAAPSELSQETETSADTNSAETNSEPAESEVVSRETKKKSGRDKRRSSKSKRDRARYKASAEEARILDKAEKVALGTLMLGAKPPCEIIINGKKTGMKTPQRAIQLPEGMHRVVLVNAEHKIRKSFKVRIKSGRTTRAIQDLSSKL
jgi:hypothetical protein